MATTLSVIKPSVNNMTARVFLRAAGLDFSERDVFGNTRTPEYLAKFLKEDVERWGKVIKDAGISME